MNPEPILIDVGELAKILRLSPRTVWRLANCGKIPAPLKIGGSRRWRRGDVEQFIAGGCKPVGKVAKAAIQSSPIRERQKRIELAVKDFLASRRQRFPDCEPLSHLNRVYRQVIAHQAGIGPEAWREVPERIDAEELAT